MKLRSVSGCGQFSSVIIFNILISPEPIKSIFKCINSREDARTTTLGTLEWILIILTRDIDIQYLFLSIRPSVSPSVRPSIRPSNVVDVVIRIATIFND